MYNSINFKRSRLRSIAGLVLVGIICLPVTTTLFGKSGVFIAEAADTTVNNWWPKDGVTVSGVQPFKANVEGREISDYSMYWKVDGASENKMSDSQTDYPHKEVSVDLSGWTWRGTGPYEITFVAKDNDGQMIASKTIKIFNGGATNVSQSASGSSEETSQQVNTQTETSSQTQTQNTVVNETQTQVSEPAVVSQPKNEQIKITESVEVWWPKNGTVMYGVQPIKAVVQNKNIADYEMYWKYEDGDLVALKNNYTDAPHKEANIDFTNWTWKGTGPYVIDLIAKSGNTIIAQTEVSVNTSVTGQTAPVIEAKPVIKPAPTPVPAPAPTPAPAPVVTQPVVAPAPVVTAPKVSATAFYIDPNSNAARQIKDWQASRPSDAEQMIKIANSPVAKWFGDWNGGNIYNDVKNYVDTANNAGKVPVMVLYNAPGRDCGSYSAGGTSSASAYASWISSVKGAIGGKKAIVILEPDALAQMDCLSSSAQQTRMEMLKSAVQTLKSNSGTTVYMDAGHPYWQSVSTISDRLNRAGVSLADGFSLNVSNYIPLADNVRYGNELGKALGGKHFVVDTSRNGLGSNGEWCNPSGRALGVQPTTNTGSTLADAFLWIKAPGESDGACNGGPNAGVWWADYALGLAKRAAY